MLFLQKALATLAGANVPTGETVKIWPFVLFGVGIVLLIALIVLTFMTKKK